MVFSSSHSPSPPGRRRKGEITAERILDAAEVLFSERGYSATTLRDVANQVGLRNPSLYNHFPSKASLYAAVLDRGIAPVLGVLTEFVDGRSQRTDPGQVALRMMELLAERRSLPRLIQHEILSGGECLTPMLRERIEPIFLRAHEMAAANPATRNWEPGWIPLLVLAFFNVAVGYFTIAPLYQDLNGEDLLTEHALAKQTRFFREMVTAILPGTAAEEAS